MSDGEVTDLVRRYLLEVWGKGKLAVVDRVCDPNVSVVYPGNPEGLHGTEQLKQLVQFVRGVFPDLEVRVEETVTEADRVVVRWCQRGTQRGEWESGVPPTGSLVTWSGMTLYRVKSGRIVEERTEEDLRDAESQMGIIIRKTPGRSKVS